LYKKINKFDEVSILDSSSKHYNTRGVVINITGPFFDVIFPDGEEERFLASGLRQTPTAKQSNE
jgi:hypothetical protein